MTEAVQANLTSLPQHAGPRAVAAERAREAFFSSLSQELRWSLDHEERLVALEGAWQSVLGWRPERLHGWHWEEIVHPADRIRVARAFERLATTSGAERDVEIRLAQATGGYRLMQWTFVAGAGADSFLGLGHARTEDQASADLARRNAELSARVAQLEERYLAVERFAATAAHQLAEPLIVAESSAIMLAEELEDVLDATLRYRLDAIGRSSARTRRLVDALLADARSADQPLSLCRVEIAQV